MLTFEISASLDWRYHGKAKDLDSRLVSLRLKVLAQKVNPPADRLLVSLQKV